MHIKSFSDVRYVTTQEIAEVMRRFGPPPKSQSVHPLAILKSFDPKPEEVKQPGGTFYYRTDSEKLLEFVKENYPNHLGTQKIGHSTVAEFYNDMIDWQVRDELK